MFPSMIQLKNLGQAKVMQVIKPAKICNVKRIKKSLQYLNDLTKHIPQNKRGVILPQSGYYHIIKVLSFVQWERNNVFNRACFYRNHN